jgi:hypothetical protein
VLVTDVGATGQRLPRLDLLMAWRYRRGVRFGAQADEATGIPPAHADPDTYCRNTVED